ncbi:MAG TPA: hypothetical protein VK324_16225, partial [Tepidisphaeraceae bacterium]|nr:hypothetical protein [Tepidisphaeraceae bacterium]
PALYVLLREYFLRFRWERVLLEPGINVVIDAGPGVGRVLLPLALLGRYTWLLLWPARLSLDYGGTTVPTTVAWDDGFLWLGAATATLFVVASVVALRSGWRAVTFCLAGLAATYALPSNTFVLIGTHLAERLLYQPSAFLFLLIGLAVAAAWDARPAAHRRAMAGAFAVLLLALAARAWTYAAEWSDERAFLARSVERQPTSVKLHVALIDYHIRHAQADDAERVAVRLVDRLPQFFQSWGWAAQAAALSGDAEATQHRLTQAMRVAGRRYYGQVADHAFVARDLLASTRARHPATAAPVEAPSPTTGPR